MQAMGAGNLFAVPGRRLTAEKPVERVLFSFIAGWQGTLLLVAFGALVGGYLGAVSVLYAWTFGRKVVLDGTVSMRRRAYIGVLTVASALILYSTAASVFMELVSL